LNQAVALGWQMLQRGNVAAAEEAIRPLMDGAISDELAPLLGAIRLQQNRHAEAVPLFAQARKAAPREARFAFLHGTSLEAMDQLTEAAAAFHDAIRHEPRAPAPYLALAEAQRKRARHDEAQNTLRKLLRQEPENIEALKSLAAVLTDAGDPASSEVPLRRALALAGDPRSRRRFTIIWRWRWKRKPGMRGRWKAWMPRRL
jgi:tetratricopeptide (TPR) repeat protein